MKIGVRELWSKEDEPMPKEKRDGDDKGDLLFDSIIAADFSPEQISSIPSQLPNLCFVLTPHALSPAELHRL